MHILAKALLWRQRSHASWTAKSTHVILALIGQTEHLVIGEVIFERHEIIILVEEQLIDFWLHEIFVLEVQARPFGLFAKINVNDPIFFLEDIIFTIVLIAKI